MGTVVYSEKEVMPQFEIDGTKYVLTWPGKMPEPKDSQGESIHPK